MPESDFFDLLKEIQLDPANLPPVLLYKILPGNKPVPATGSGIIK